METLPTAPYTQLVQQFKAAPPGKLYCLHGRQENVFRISLTAAAHVLLNGSPVTLVDGTNRFDLYGLAEFARRHAPAAGNTPRTGETSPDGKMITPQDMLDNIFISRAFTCYQMEAVITDRLPAFVRRSRSPVVIIFGLLDTFYDEQAPFFEVKASLRRIIDALHALRDRNVAILLASMDMKLASPERNSLLPLLLRAMDRVYELSGEEGRPLVAHTGRPAETRRLPRVQPFNTVSS
jgi:hypothetical protein